MIPLDPMALAALMVLAGAAGVGVGASVRFPKRPPAITDPDLVNGPLGPIVSHGQARWQR
ncbi:hypothetical protein [Gordonia sp. MMO-8]|uniref:hypothetical protein n=1 Tax=Gordonia sp. MMO-8 TaxID=3127886 RepID=UPI003015DCF6